MVQLAHRRRYATSSGTVFTHHAIWIPVEVVWQRSNAAERIHGGRSVAARLEAEEKGAHPPLQA